MWLIIMLRQYSLVAIMHLILTPVDGVLTLLLLWRYYTMLDENDFVHVFSFDFSKAFDTVRHASLMTRFAQLEIPDESPAFHRFWNLRRHNHRSNFTASQFTACWIHQLRLTSTNNWQLLALGTSIFLYVRLRNKRTWWWWWSADRDHVLTHLCH